MYGKCGNITGKRFGMLTAIKFLRREKGHDIWLCECDCGTEREVSASKLANGNTKSCGCLRRSTAKQHIGEVNARGISVKHGLYKSRLYSIWCGMKSRCENESRGSYQRYGARGISVCKSWKNDFTAFYKWALEHGYSDELTIDRIDNEKGYSPENCRWVTRAVQQNNTSRNRLVSFDGVTKSVAEWSRESGIPAKAILYRLKQGWPVERALREPIHEKYRRKEE